MQNDAKGGLPIIPIMDILRSINADNAFEDCHIQAVVKIILWTHAVRHEAHIRQALNNISLL